MARAIGIESIEGDGNDVELVHRVCREAVKNARAGFGPTFFEFTTYRWREHCGSEYDNHIGYRTEAEYLAWKAQCPLARMEARMLGSGKASQTVLNEIRAGLDKEIEAAMLFARQSPFPDARTMSADIVAGQPT